MDETVRNEIIRQHVGGASRRRIARLLSVSRNTIRKAILEYEAARAGEDIGNRQMPAQKRRRKSVLDTFDDRIRILLKRYPDITAVRLLQELKTQGFEGHYTIVRERLNELRPKLPQEPVLRFETSPGVQGQMDYSPYTIDFLEEGKRRVHAFSLVLGYSRRQYLRFVESEDFENTVRQHIRAFEHLDGVPRVILYDNMKVVVLRHDVDELIYNPRFLAFATHYGFRPWACRPRRAQTKGKVERPFFYVEENLLNARTFRSLEHLNHVAAWWLEEVADVRIHRETRRKPVDLWKDEREHLIPLPDQPYEVVEVVYRIVNAEGFVQWRGNFYPVPWHLIGRLLPVKVKESELVIYDHRIKECSRHPLFPRSCTGERAPSNRRFPRPERAQSETALRERFRELGDSSVAFLDGLIRSRRYGRHQAVKVLSLRESFRREDIISAIERALKFRAYSFEAIERILSAQATPLSPLELLEERSKSSLEELFDGDPIEPRPTSDYQELLDDQETSSKDRDDGEERQSQ